MKWWMPGEDESWREWKGGRKTDEAKGAAFQKCLKNCRKWLDKSLMLDCSRGKPAQNS